MTEFPNQLYRKIASLLKDKSKSYQNSYEAVSERYRKNHSYEKGLSSYDESVAYALGRLPATFQVFSYALQELKKTTNINLSSFLDVGSGPGSSYWAIKEIYPNLRDINLLENNPFMCDLLKMLAKDENNLSLIQEDSYQFTPIKTYDLISFSYSLGEMRHQEKILDTYWSKTKEVLIITEPGTPQGFQTILKARSFLRKQNAFFIAPCGHEGYCPLSQQKKDWCHFSVRIQRTDIHKKVKTATLDYENEKFSYLIASKNPLLPLQERIIKKPLKNHGHIRFDLCTEEGIKRKIITKSEKEVYREAKNKKWGDVL